MSHFGRVFGFAMLVAIFLAGAAPEVVAQKKKGAANADTSNSATVTDYKNLQKAKDITGTIIAVNSGTVTFKTDNAHVEANPKYKAPKVGTANYNNSMNQLYRTATEVPVILLQLGLETAEEGERVGGRTRETGKNLVLVQPSDLFRIVFHHARAERNLTVPSHNDMAVAANT